MPAAILLQWNRGKENYVNFYRFYAFHYATKRKECSMMLPLLKRSGKSPAHTKISYGKAAFGKVVFLPTEELAPNPMQPRRQFDENALQALAESIRQHGMLQPITVREAEPIPFPENIRSASFEIIAGERRWRAARIAGLEKVPCVIRRADRKESAELALIENLQRRDLGFFEEAEAIRTLLLMTSLSQAEMAARLSLSPSALSNKLRLLRLSQEERQLIAENDLGERHARAFLKIREGSLRKRAILQAIREGLSAAETEALADRFNSEQTAFSSFEEQPADTEKNMEKKVEKREKPRQRISLIRDLRFFFNTLDRAFSMLEEAGFRTEQQKEETDSGYEIRLFVSKSANRD